MPDGRHALLKAALRVFAGNGFDGADIRNIAAAAGVSANLVRVHFGSKRGLWEACLDEIVAAAAPAMVEISKVAHDGVRDLHERLRGIIVLLAAFYTAHPDVRDFVARHGVDAPERATMLTERLLLPAYETVRELFEAGIAEGIIRSSHPALFFALVNSAVNQPPTFPTLLNQLAPEIDGAAARELMKATVVATLLHQPS
jgi:AcrR family transcriptional regulator